MTIEGERYRQIFYTVYIVYCFEGFLGCDLLVTEEGCYLQFTFLFCLQQLAIFHDLFHAILFRQIRVTSILHYNFLKEIISNAVYAISLEQNNKIIR